MFCVSTPFPPPKHPQHSARRPSSCTVAARRAAPCSWTWPLVRCPTTSASVSLVLRSSRPVPEQTFARPHGAASTQCCFVVLVCIVCIANKTIRAPGPQRDLSSAGTMKKCAGSMCKHVLSLSLSSKSATSHIVSPCRSSSAGHSHIQRFG